MANAPGVTAIARQPRKPGIRQADIARAIKGALQGGMDVREVFATPHGIRILSSSAAPSSSALNEWDEVLSDG
ncbi:hypothetical protein [Pararhizobium gei]|uniref:hypothetical protein n=1 Tax=Pararhizobium gei TaxID=1395951 RepID=UPI0023D9A349|nr:hypothetical protein [Rhizobium gei]